MRRISLAMALLGAVAAAGCSGSSTPNTSGSAKGTPGVTFTVQVRGDTYWMDGATKVNRPQGGTVISLPAGINCGPTTTACSYDFPAGTEVILDASTTPNAYHSFAGDCYGPGECKLSGLSDKMVLVRFASSPSGFGTHPNFSSPSVHGPEYLKLQQGLAGAYDCASCHGGAALLGAGLAPSCAACHEWPLGPHMAVTATDHNGGSCARCHTAAGFREYLGVTGGTDKHELGYTATTGYGKAAAVATVPAPAGMDCAMCHNSATVLGDGVTTGALSTIRFPSATVNTAGITVTVDKVTAICGQCHTTVRDDRNIQTVASKIATAAPATLDTVLSTGNSAVRPHYLGAASTMLGRETGTYAQYAGNIYTGRNEHGGKPECSACHNPHTGELPGDGTKFYQVGGQCGACHFDELSGAPVTTMLQIEEQRQFGFEGDIDGDGAVESLKLEVEGLKAKLLAALRAYGKAIGGADMCFVIEAGSGMADQPYVLTDETQGCNVTLADGVTKVNNVAYNKFTTRSLKAAFNYMAIQNDPGAWAHNPRYAVEILYDSIADLNVALAPLSPAQWIANGKRAFNGHFGAAEDPSPYAAMIYHGGANAVTGEVLPSMGFTSAACYQCHGGKGGFDAYVAGAPAALAATVIADANKVSAMQCSTCHALDGKNMTAIREVGTVYFPPQKNNGATSGQVSFTAAQLPPGFTVCATCHSGRENGQTITVAIGTTTDTTWSLGFKNPHYLGAAGIMMGSNAAVMYQYTGKAYTGYPAFWSLTANGPHGSPHGAQCTSCHAPKGSAHTFEIDTAKTVAPGTYQGAANTKACDGCHTQSAYGDYRLAPKALEYEEASAELYAAIRKYAQDNVAAIQTATANANATGVCYNGSANPYFFLEVSGVCQDGVANAPAASASFGKFNPKLLKAAYNYQWTQKDPGGWAHNEFYVLQVIYDSIVDLGGTPGFTVSASTTDPTLNRP